MTPSGRTAIDWLARVRSSEADAELFVAYDLALQGIAEFPDDIALKHRAVLCLASTGASRQAAEQFRHFELDRIAERSEIPQSLRFDIVSLEARLLKDEAVATKGPNRRLKLAQAADAYEAVYRSMRAVSDLEAYYPGINCATLRLLAGDHERSAALAGEVVFQLAGTAHQDKGYYELATELEAFLLLDNVPAAREKAVETSKLARESLRRDYRALASTIRQLRLLIAAKGLSADVIAPMLPPRVIHYVGHIISAPGSRGRFLASDEEQVRRRIDAHIEETGTISFAYGSLAAGADILFAEAILKRGGSLHVVLPFDVEEFIDISVRPSGEVWVDRFDRCRDAAVGIHFATTDRYLGDMSLFGYCSQLAMGLALLQANQICAPVEQIALWDGKPPAAPVGTAVDVACWRRTAKPQTTIPLAGAEPPSESSPVALSTTGRRTRAMLFGDVKGFSKLTDEQLPKFVDAVLRMFARVVGRVADDTLLVNTWGDGLFLVFDDAGKAAACALALQEGMAEIDLAATGLPQDLMFRLGGHLGPVYDTIDPVLNRTNFFGAHVNRAARIEPVTPAKLVYVTEPFAAVLALHNADTFDCGYVGLTKAAKDAGEMRMFLLSRRSGS